MGLRRRDVVAACAGRWRTVRCGCGDRPIPVGCDQVQLCERCSKAHWRKWNRRITSGLDDKLREAVALWGRRGARGRRPGVYLVTFTVPHSGDLVTDRARLGAAWRKVSKRAGAWLGAYAATYETTSGRDRQGHVHLHAAVVSSWIPYRELHALWSRAMPGGLHPDVQAPRAVGGDGSSAAANYLASYVTKGCNPSDFTGEKAAELLVAFRGRRKVTTSVGFWRVVERRCCDACGVMHSIVEQPPSFSRHVVATAWAAAYPWWLRPKPPAKWDALPLAI